MDNKQKKKLYKLIYKTLALFIFLCVCFDGYLVINNLTQNVGILELNIAFIVVQVLILLFTLAETSKTNHMKNKYGLAILLYIFTFVSAISVMVLIATKILGVFDISSYEINIMLIISMCNILLIVLFILGLKLSKLFQNTTITIDSTSDTPNFSDELLLRKKLEELDRKLEIKKVQEKIDKVQKELDGE